MLHPGLFESDYLKDQELLEHHRNETRHLSSVPGGVEGDGNDVQGGAGAGDHE